MVIEYYENGLKITKNNGHLITEWIKIKQNK